MNSLFDWNLYSPQESAVLCFIQQDGRVLLIEKKRGLGAGKINGPGGKLEPGESFSDAAIRETQEEVGLTVLDPEWRASLDFFFADGFMLHVRVFVATRFNGTLCETEEAKPFWTDTETIAFEEMWEDDKLWLPIVLAGSLTAGRFCFDGDTMVSSEMVVGTREMVGYAGPHSVSTGSSDLE